MTTLAIVADLYKKRCTFDFGSHSSKWAIQIQEDMKLSYILGVSDSQDPKPLEIIPLMMMVAILYPTHTTTTW